MTKVKSFSHITTRHVKFLLTLLAITSIASADDLGPIKINTQLNILTNAKDMTAYVFDKDTPGVSNCNGACATEWPPILAPEGELKAPLSVVVRKDQSRQVAYKNRPLYLYVEDSAPGEISGDGYSSVWHVARP